MRYKRHPIGDYAQGYVRRFNNLCVSERKEELLSALFLKQIGQAVCYWAADGVVIFFFPKEVVEQDKTGVYLYDRLSESLSFVVQSYTGNLVKVTPAPSAPIMADLSNLPDLPADLEKAKIRTGYINPELSSENWVGSIRVTGVAVAPVRHFEDGLLVKTLESRFHLWSPTLRVPSGKEVRQYSWIAADFLWYENDVLSEKFGEEAAESDFHVLRLGRRAGIGAEKLSEDPFGSVSQSLLEVCRQFEALINRGEVDEPEIQHFLNEPAHQFIISPVHRAVYPQRRLGGGKFVLDFAVHRADDEWEFVEIEAPGKIIYTAAGEEQSAHLTHALSQVDDWLRFVDDNRQAVEQEDGLAGIYRPWGRVVAGRDADIGVQARRRFKFKRAETPRVQLQTYDLLLREARAYAEVLARVGAHRSEYRRKV